MAVQFAFSFSFHKCRFHLLNEGEYTTPIRYSDKPDLPSLSEMGEWWSKVYTTYVKVSKHDRPLRLDYLETNRPVVPIVAATNAVNKPTTATISITMGACEKRTAFRATM